MIYKAIHLIQSQLKEYIQPGAGPDEVVLGNIAFNEAPDQNNIKDKVVLSLVNVEEEGTLKNGRNYIRTDDRAQYSERPVYLNLYLLITAHYAQAYNTALIRLGSVIEFFQNRKFFDVRSAAPLPDGLDPSDPEDASMYLTMELYTLTFEQINHLWGSLGGKQMPFVMYKVRLVKVHDNRIYQEGPLIEEIHQNLSNAENAC